MPILRLTVLNKVIHGSSGFAAVLLIAATVGCARKSPIVGKWTNVRFEEHYEFRSDQTYTWTLPMEGRVNTEQGHYTFDGATLRLKGEAGKARLASGESKKLDTYDVAYTCTLSGNQLECKSGVLHFTLKRD